MKNAKLFFLFLMTIGLLLLFSCKEKSKSEIAKEKIEGAADAVGDLFEKESDGLKGKIEKAREKIGDKIDTLKDDLDGADDNAKVKIQNGIDRLERQRDKLDANLDRIGKNVKDDWTSFKSNVNNTLKEINKDL